MLVVDTSVALKWVLDDEDSEAAEQVAQEELTAPSLWLVEAAHVLWKHVRAGEIDIDEGRARFRELRTSPVTSLPIDPYIDDAAMLSERLDHASYDCLFLAVALSRSCQLITADVRFYKAVQRDAALAPSVRLL